MHGVNVNKNLAKSKSRYILYILFISEIQDTVDSGQLGQLLEDKTIGEYNQNFLCLFGT
jgi:hypothetical protein